jgi:hypothetical protein
MTRKRSLTEVPVPDELREAVLNIAVALSDGSMTSVGLLVQSASEALQKANEALKGNGLVDLASKDLMRQHRRRGNARIIVTATGGIMLQIGTSDSEPGIVHTTAPGGAGLPHLGKLRALALQRGIDISDLGRRKREIMERLAEGVSNPPTRLRDEVRTSTPLPDIKLPR